MKRHIFLLSLLLCCLPMVLPAQVFLSENFNQGIPPTWTVVNGGSSAATWIGTSGGYNGASLDGTEFAFVNSDGAGNFPPVWVSEQLVSPVLNTAGATTLLLEYDHYFKGLGQTDSGHVEVFDGSAWVGVAHYGANTGAFSNPAHVQLNLTAYANANLQVRFRYDDDTLWAWYWALDNVQLYAPTPDDASLQAALSPLSNGRQFTQSALGSAVPVSVQLRNTGSTTIAGIPLYYRINGGPVTGPEILAGPLASNATQAFTFAATANLSAPGAYHIAAWTALPGDINPANDTLRFQVQQWANAPLLFPHCQGFELAPNLALQTDVIGIPGVEELDFTTNAPTEGRLRTFAGPGFARTGFRALTLDRNPSGPDAKNAALLTYNLSGLQAATDQVLLDFALMDHGDEVQLGDSVWIRGCDTCPWLRIFAWNDLSGGNNGNYITVHNYDLSAALAAAGQNYSSSFQLKFGQEDNFNTTTTIGSDGVSFDDICLRRIFEENARPIALISPRPGECGDSSFVFVAAAENSGRDTLAPYPITLVCSGAANGILTGTLPAQLPGQRDTIIFAGTLNTYAGGPLHYTLITDFPGDDYPADDTLHGSLALLGRPAPPVVQGDTVCIGTAAQLDILHPQPGQFYYWYDQAYLGTLLDTGRTFTTPPITGPLTYYAETRLDHRAHIGPASNAIGAGGPYAVYDAGIEFDAYRAFALDSLTCYPGDTGLVCVVLRDSFGVSLDSLCWLVEPATPYELTRLHVGMDVPAGMQHTLSAEGSTVFALWRNTSGAAYPYTLPDVASILGPLNNLSSYYYFWYDLAISYPDCPGARQAVRIDTASVPALAAFQASATGLDLAFSNSSSNALGYLWDLGDGTTSTAASPTHTYASDDTFRVCLIAYSPCGNDTSCQDLVVDCLAPAPDFAAFPVNLNVTFVDSTVGAVSRFWYFGDGTAGISAGPNITHFYQADGIYNVCLRVTNACGDTALACDSLAFCRPLTCALSYTVSPDGLTYTFTPFTLTQSIVSYLWDFGDGSTSTLSNPTHTYLSAGPRIVRLTVTNLCGEMSFNTEAIQVVVGVESPFPSVWQVSPNPSEGRFVLDWGGNVPTDARIRVLDAQGRALAVPITDLGAQGREIDLRARAAGTYFLKVEGEEAIRHFRLVKW